METLVVFNIDFSRKLRALLPSILHIALVLGGMITAIIKPNTLLLEMGLRTPFIFLTGFASMGGMVLLFLKSFQLPITKSEIEIILKDTPKKERVEKLLIDAGWEKNSVLLPDEGIVEYRLLPLISGKQPHKLIIHDGRNETPHYYLEIKTGKPIAFFYIVPKGF